MLNNGSAVQCPRNQCTQEVVYRGLRTIATWKAYADGYAGYIPNTARYTGNGNIKPIGFDRPTITKRNKSTLWDTDLRKLNSVSPGAENVLGQASSFPWEWVIAFKLSEDEVSTTRDDVETLLNSGDCKSFIENLITNAGKIINPTPENEETPNKVIDTNPLSLFDKVRMQGGFRQVPGYISSTIEGSLGNNTALVLIAGGGNTLPNDLDRLAPGASREDHIRQYQSSIRAAQALTIIHELIHFNFGDEQLAQTLTGKVYTNLLEASRTWNAELAKHCDVGIVIKKLNSKR
jgi:hypothetical protein